jgi:hypothetical protein
MMDQKQQSWKRVNDLGIRLATAEDEQNNMTQRVEARAKGQGTQWEEASHQIALAKSEQTMMSKWTAAALASSAQRQNQPIALEESEQTSATTQTKALELQAQRLEDCQIEDQLSSLSKTTQEFTQEAKAHHDREAQLKRRLDQLESKVKEQACEIASFQQTPARDTRQESHAARHATPD